MATITRQTLLAAAVSALAALTGLPGGAQSFDEWRDPEINAVNRAPMHASFFAYADREEACQAVREDSENYLTLNGQWKFKWVRHSWQRPTGFWSAGFDDTDWDRIPVPGIWEMNGSPCSCPWLMAWIWTRSCIICVFCHLGFSE